MEIGRIAARPAPRLLSSLFSRLVLPRRYGPSEGDHLELADNIGGPDTDQPIQGRSIRTVIHKPNRPVTHQRVTTAFVRASWIPCVRKTVRGDRAVDAVAWHDFIGVNEVAPVRTQTAELTARRQRIIPDYCRA